MRNSRALIVFILLSELSIFSQVTLTLTDALMLAKKQSIEFQIERNNFLSEYWSYRLSKINLLPHINLNANPITINRSLTERYDFQTNIETYRESKTLSSNSGLSVNQVIPLTGGNVSLRSNISKITNFGTTNFSSYNLTPISVSFSQPLFSHNSYRWEKKTLPLKLKIAKQKLIQSEQTLNIKVVNQYFNLLRAIQLFEVTKQDVLNSDTLFESGKRLLELKVITQNDLIELELNKTNAEISLAQKEKALKKARFEFNKLLNIDSSTKVNLEYNNDFPLVRISADEAILLAQLSNPFYTKILQSNINLQKSIDQAKKKDRFKANLNLSYGLNQGGNSFNDIFQKPQNRQSGSFSFSIPILNWGSAKGNLIIKQRNKETIELMNQQNIESFEEELAMKVIDFNLQTRVVNSSLTAENLSTKLYKLRMQQFTLGRCSLMELNNAHINLLRAKNNWIDSLYKYWAYYYELQKTVMHNLITKQELTADFDELMNLLR